MTAPYFMFGAIIVFTIAGGGAAIACSKVLEALQGTPVEERIVSKLGQRGDYVDRSIGLHPLNQHVWWELLRATDLPEPAARNVGRLKWWCALMLIAFACAAFAPVGNAP